MTLSFFRIYLFTFIPAFILLSCTPTVKIEAPDKPIVVNLNVKLKHEIKKEMQKDSDIF